MYLSEYISTAIDNDEAYSLRGYCNSQLGLYQESKKDYDKAVFLNPNDHKHYSNRGLLNLKTGNFEEALNDYDKAIKLCPIENLKNINNRGWAKYKLGKIEESCKDFKYCADKNFEPSILNVKKYCQ